MSGNFGAAAMADLCIFILLGILLTITLCISISSWTISAENSNTTCDTSSFMTLRTWLIIVAVVAPVLEIIAIITYVIKRAFEILLVFMFIGFIISVIFFGMGLSILLASTCYNAAYQLFQISVAALFFQGLICLLGLAAIAFLIRSVVKARNESSYS